MRQRQTRVANKLKTALELARMAGQNGLEEKEWLQEMLKGIIYNASVVCEQHHPWHQWPERITSFDRTGPSLMCVQPRQGCLA